MPLIVAADGAMPVEYGQFAVAAGTADSVPEMYDGTDDFLQVDEGSIWCISAGGYHTASVRFEVWDDAPPLLEGWEKERTATLVRGRGPVYAVGLMGGPTICELPMDASVGQQVTTRVYCRGREQLRQWMIDDGGIPPDPIEQWLVQFWPK